VRGYKFSYNHIEKYPAILPWLQRNDILIIHLIRRNLVKRYLSHLTKKVRGQAHSTQPVEAVRVHVSPRKLMKNVERQEHLLDKYQRIFAAAPKAYLEVDYEAFVSNRGVENRSRVEFLERP
jgi:hypothetical protein